LTNEYLVGLVGRGIQMSLSPSLHETEARALGLDYKYLKLDVDNLRAASSLGDVLTAARTLGFTGLNITHPFKQAVIDCLDEVSDEASEIGAVNTVVFDASHTTGYNTDSYGYQQLALGSLVGHRTDRVVQFGAGGAGSAVAYGHLDGFPGRLDLVDIDTDRARVLAEKLARRFGGDRIGWAPTSDIAALVAEADGFVNATPMGMAAHPGSPIPAGIITAHHWVIDIVYMPLRTQLMIDAEVAGAHVVGGHAMTAYQAAKAFELFTGQRPDIQRMLAQIQREVAGRLASADG
jgi:shikimate dehydrogenase